MAKAFEIIIINHKKSYVCGHLQLGMRESRWYHSVNMCHLASTTPGIQCSGQGAESFYFQKQVDEVEVFLNEKGKYLPFPQKLLQLDQFLPLGDHLSMDMMVCSRLLQLLMITQRSKLVQQYTSCNGLLVDVR